MIMILKQKKRKFKPRIKLNDNIGITPPSPGIRSAQAASHDSVNVLLCKPGTINYCPLAKCGKRNHIPSFYSFYVQGWRLNTGKTNKERLILLRCLNAGKIGT